MDVREKLVELILSTDLGLSYSRESDAWNIADTLVDNGVNICDWISVDDKLPENDQWVLVCKKEIKNGMQIIAVDRCTLTVGGDRMWLADYTTWKQKVTHWQYLPQPPKGE